MLSCQFGKKALWQVSGKQLVPVAVPYQKSALTQWNAHDLGRDLGIERHGKAELSQQQGSKDLNTQSCDQQQRQNSKPSDPATCMPNRFVAL